MKWTVEYSVSQKCFNVDLLEDTLEDNLSNAVRGIASDYQILAILDSYEDCNEYIKKIREMSNKF